MTVHSLPAALEYHRATRAKYIAAAREAGKRKEAYMRNMGTHSFCGCGAFEWSVRQWNFHDGAQVCFVRQARIANRRLLSLKGAVRWLAQMDAVQKAFEEHSKAVQMKVCP